MTGHCSLRSFTSTGREGALSFCLVSLIEKEGGKGERESDDQACTKPKSQSVVQSYQKSFLI